MIAITPNKAEMREIKRTLRSLEKHMTPPEMRKVMGNLSAVMAEDVHYNFDHDRTFDDQRMPKLKSATIKHKQKIGKTTKLFISGFLQKIQIKVTSTMAMIFSPARYALPLNDRQKHGAPFKFMGFGKRLLKKIDTELKHWMDKLGR